MPVNEEIYGSKENWPDLSSSWNSSIPSKDRVKTVYFGSADYTANTLELGVSAGKIETNKPIDKSLSYCGLGANSAFSNVQYISIASILSTTTMDDVAATYTEDREVTNFAFSLGYRGSDSYQDWFNGNTSSQGNNYRWSPSTNSVGYYNTSRSSTFISSFSFKNFILLIIVYCCDGFRADSDGEPRNATSCTLADYENDVNSVRTNHPIIYAVTIQPYCRYSANANRQPMQVWQTPTGIAILDGYEGTVSAPIGEPLYTYGQTRNDAGVWILHGMTSARNVHQGILYQDSSPGLIAFLVAAIPSTWKVKKTLHRGSYICAQTYREYDSEFFEECLHAAACFGCFFTPDATTATSGNLWDENMYCGILEDGIGNGEYTQGVRNVTLPQFNEWDTTNDTKYDPSGGGGGGDTPYDSQTTRITAGNGIAVGGNWYVDTLLTTWLGLLQWCSGLDLGNYPKDEYFFGQNPIDCILEGKMIFVDDYKFGKAVMQNKSTIQLGSYSGGDGVDAYSFTNAYPKTFNCGSITIGDEYRYGDFRDFEPYTNLTMLLPFATSIELPPNIVIGHTVTLEETIDPQSGDLKYHVYIDGTEYASANGNCAIDLSINGLEIATYRQQKFNLQTQSVMSTYNAAASLVGGASGALIAGNYGNIAGAASQILGGIVNASSGLYQAQRYKEESSHLKPPPARIQNSTPNVEWGDCAFPCIVMTAPYMLEGYTAASYQQLVGFATYTVDLIKNHTYWVKCEEVTLSGLSCTDTEQKAIKELLQSGIYIKPKQS